MSFAPAMSTTGAARRRASRSGPGTSTVAAGTDLSGIAQDINPQVRGWINYYGAFYRSELYSLAAAHRRASRPMGHAEIQTTPRQAHAGHGGGWTPFDSASPPCSPTGTSSRIHPTPDCGSRMTGDCHVRFCESGRGRFPPATHQKSGRGDRG